MHRVVALGSLLMVAACADAPRVPEPGRDAHGANGAVTADHPLAAQAGLAVLQRGGNAMDAAITMAGVLAVARPHMNGVGGDMFLLYYDAGTGTVHGLNASGPAGSRASVQRVKAQDPTRTRMPGAGPMSVSVPGAVRGWAEALRRFGTISWQDALQPAVELARHGLPVSERLAADLAEEAEKLARDSVAARIYLPGGKPPAAGDTLRQDDLAQTLARLQQNGPDEAYTGETGRKTVSHVQALGGFLEPRDLASYRPEWVEPISAEYRGLTVLAMPPNTQGVTLLEALTLLRDFDLARLGHNSADYLHTLAQAIRIAVEDRDTSVAEPRAMRVTVGQLLDPARLGALASTIDPTGRAPSPAGTDGADQPNTVYIIAVDPQGNVVSMIQSLFASFGSGIVVPGTGVVLHNRGSLFSLDPRHPNVLAAGKRPYHTLCPALVLDGTKPWLAFGTPGGDGQTHTLVQVLHNIALFGMTPQDAIDAPRMRRLESGTLAIEDRIPAAVIQALEERGYRVSARTGWTATFGGAQAILIDPETGEKRAGADRRREAFALAY
ncbi:MAG TPA: gamma-glutamyltransferase [Gemmatimonadales bacterium]|nr:gamma-glutamyltransferase [Gemmatimonadales bacterium]